MTTPGSPKTVYVCSGCCRLGEKSALRHESCDTKLSHIAPAVCSSSMYVSLCVCDCEFPSTAGSEKSPCRK